MMPCVTRWTSRPGAIPERVAAAGCPWVAFAAVASHPLALRSFAVAAAERFGQWRIAKRLSARPVGVGHPWHRRLLIYAGFDVVANSSRKRLLELDPLHIGEQIREVLGTVHGLELTFRGVVGERLARTQARRAALR